MKLSMRQHRAKIGGCMWKRVGFRRHKESCVLCVGGCEYPFDSYASASRFASQEYGAKYSMLMKWHKWHDITIKCND